MLTHVIRPADVCLPFTVRVGEGVGRYVVATRDIKAGQVRIMATTMLMMDDEDDVWGFVEDLFLHMMIVMRLVVDNMYLISQVSQVSQVRLPGDP